MSGEQEREEEEEKEEEEEEEEEEKEEEDTPSAVRRAFNLPTTTSIPLEVTVESPDGQMELGELVLTIQQIRYCVSVAIFLGHYTSWKLGLGPQSASMKTTFRRFETWLRALPPDQANYFDDFAIASRISEELQQFGITRRSPFYNEGINTSIDTDLDILRSFHDVDLFFFGAFLTNPTTLRILAKGAAAATFSLALFFGGVLVLKEIGAPQCRANAALVAQLQRDALIANKPNLGQNKYTEALADISKAYNVTASACAPQLDYSLKLPFDKIGDFAVRLAPVGVAEARPEKK